MYAGTACPRSPSVTPHSTPSHQPRASCTHISFHTQGTGWGQRTLFLGTPSIRKQKAQERNDFAHSKSVMSNSSLTCVEILPVSHPSLPQGEPSGVRLPASPGLCLSASYGAVVTKQAAESKQRSQRLEWPRRMLSASESWRPQKEHRQQVHHVHSYLTWRSRRILGQSNNSLT